jgi:hypothetical protein
MFSRAPKFLGFLGARVFLPLTSSLSLEGFLARSFGAGRGSFDS